jgi:hypothetical protein
MPPDFLTRKQTQAIKQDSDPAIKLRHLIQCHANPGAWWTEGCLELVDELVAKISELDALWTESNASYYEMMAERDSLRARLASGDIQGVDP